MNKSFWDFSECRLLITSPGLNDAWSDSAPLHAKGRLIAKASLKGHAIKLCSCFNKALTDWLHFSIWTDVIFGLGQVETLPSVHVHNRVCKEMSQRWRTPYLKAGMILREARLQIQIWLSNASVAYRLRRFHLERKAGWTGVWSGKKLLSSHVPQEGI